MLITVKNIDFKHHPLFTSGQDLQEIISPLLPHGINHFSYSRLDADWGQIHLTNTVGFSELYIRQKFYQRYLNGTFDQYTSGYFLGDLLNIGQEFKEACCAHNMWHFFIITRRNKENTEIFYFGAPPEASHINHFYLNNINVLENFILGFKEKMSTLIKTHETQRVIYPIHQDITGLIELPQKISLANLNSLKLTMRENQCLSYFRQGYSAKMIARHLNISHRTVEHHLAHIRKKLKLHTTKQLLLF